MLGDRNLRGMVEKALDRLYGDINIKIDRDNSDRIHAFEASRCTRLAYYERKDPLPPDNATRVSILLDHGIRKGFSHVKGEYRADSLILEAEADMVVGDDFAVRFEIVPSLPEVPHPRHMLYLNACLFALDKSEGFLVYMTADGKTVEFDITRNNRMFEEVVRRARVLSTLLKEGKTPIVEPSDLCMTCKYYTRCYAREKVKDQPGDFIAEIFGGSSKKKK